MTVDSSILSATKIIEKYINPRIAFEPNTGCWVWLGYLQRGNYATAKLPRIGNSEWSTENVARVLYGHSNKSISVSRILQNQCKTKGCVNPDHHRLLTIREWRRGLTYYKRRAQRTKCIRDHLLTDENVLTNYQGTKECRMCRQDRNKKHAEKKRAEDWRKFGEFIESYKDNSPEPARYYVYHLIDPRNGNIFYVGKGSGPRVLQHERDILAGAISSNPKKERVIKSIWANGLDVQFNIVHRNLTELRALWLEQQEIERIGINNLTNRNSVAIPWKYREKMYA